MVLQVSEDLVVRVVPSIVYWLYSGAYILMSGPLENYRLHSKKDEDEKNLVSRASVVKSVLFMQAIEFVANTILFSFISTDDGSNGEKSLLSHALQFFTAMVVLDTWQYFLHRVMHESKFLYNHLHAQHHRLIVPYAFGALYCHPIAGLLLDTVGGLLTILISGMSPRVSVLFFSFATIKTIDDHCGFMLPWNPFHIFFENNTAFHDSHHQLSGTKFNYSPAFFVFWDKILGTYKPYSLEKKANGGFESRTSKEYYLKKELVD